jgi:hypothetical protein
MKYNFDVLKSRTAAGLSMIGVVLVPMFLMAILFAPALSEYIPDFLYKNILLPLIILVLAPVYLIYNKKQLFWKNVDVILDKVNAELTIDGKQYSFDDLEYYELKEGSLLTSDVGRHFLILKFKHCQKTELVPCRTSDRIMNYDAFLTHFLAFIDMYFEEDKEKTENRVLRQVAVALLVIAHISFFALLFLYGLNASKIIPAILVVYGVCLPIIFKRKGTNRKRTNSHNKVQL